jgi:hypothetical protein
MRAWREANRERLKAERRAKYAANPEKFIAYQRENREKNREKVSAQRKARYAARREQILAARKEAYARNGEAIRARGAAYRSIDRVAYRERMRAWKYGITVERLRKVLAPGKCAICDGAGGKRGLFIDHDHASGRVRGLLCGTCNAAIGFLRENEGLLASAAAYLRGFAVPDEPSSEEGSAAA